MSESSERPTPAVGQRWGWFEVQQWTLTAKREDGDWSARDQNRNEGIWSDGMFASPNATYLGGPTTAPEVPTGWAVGQRRRGDIRPGRDSTEAYDDLFECEYVVDKLWTAGAAYDWWVIATDGTHWGVCESWPSTLLTDAPAAPGAPPRCESCGGTGNDVEEMKRDAHGVPACLTCKGTGKRWCKPGFCADPERCPPCREPSPLREVSHDGRTWIDYTRLTDADSFEAYRFRRVDGVVAAIAETRGVVRPTWGDAMKVVCTWHDHQEPGSAKTVRCDRPTANPDTNLCEEHIALAMPIVEARQRALNARLNPRRAR